MKRLLQAIAVLLLFGIAKLPVERAATQSLVEAHLLSPPLKMDVRDRVGQMTFVAAFGGLRSLVASITYLQAYEEWKNMRWAKVDSLFKLITLLQPRYAKYWDDASWHMGYNAASSYLFDEELKPALRGQLYRDYVHRGIDILKDGLRALPDDPMLWVRLAEIYDRRELDHQKAAECYLQALRITKNTRFIRFAGYQYAQTMDPLLWRKAYDLLKSAYDNPKQRRPSVIAEIKSLEKRLEIPLAQRIPDPDPQGPVHQDPMGPNR